MPNLILELIPNLMPNFIVNVIPYLIPNLIADLIPNPIPNPKPDLLTKYLAKQGIGGWGPRSMIGPWVLGPWPEPREHTNKKHGQMSRVAKNMPHGKD